jgi:hypothetical protein
MTLTDADRRIIAKARALSDAAGLEAVRGAAAPEITTYAEAYGVARYLLGELTAIIDRLNG